MYPQCKAVRSALDVVNRFCEKSDGILNRPPVLVLRDRFGYRKNPVYRALLRRTSQRVRLAQVAFGKSNSISK
jgi:hypothetical protein